jgi:uncharacterized repeat protein (TIGR03847 family)
MPRHELELKPVEHITTDAIGKPGQRVFYIQAWDHEQRITLIVEKVQITSLALEVQFQMQQIDDNREAIKLLTGKDLLPATTDYDESKMHILPPVDPLYRVGEIGLDYNAKEDLVCLIAHEILSGDMSNEDASVARLWCTRSQLLAMCAWGLEVASHGRPTCPQCGGPIDPDGHFCPKKNGHKH